MSNIFEVIDLGEVNRGLRVEIDAGIGCMGSESEPDTDFYIKPPLTEAEHSTLLEELGTENKVGELLVGGTVKEGEWIKFTADGEPSQEHVDLGVELAKEIITLRGLKAGKVVAAIDNQVQAHLLRTKSEAELAGENVTVIDADEFEEAKRDPEWQAFLQEAKKVGERQTEIDYQREHAHLVHIEEATETAAVLRSPATGRLYCIGMDQGPDGEEVNVTELEELETDRRSE